MFVWGAVPQRHILSQEYDIVGWFNNSLWHVACNVILICKEAAN